MSKNPKSNTQLTQFLYCATIKKKSAMKKFSSFPTGMGGNSKDLKDAEFLSGFSKEDKLTPVITIVIYWGNDEWDAPRSLHEMLNTSDEQVLQYVDNYHTNLVIPTEIKDFTAFKTRLGAVLSVFKNSVSKEAYRKMIDENPEKYQNVDTESAMLLNTFLNMKIDLSKAKEGVVDVCKAFEEMKKEGKIEEIFDSVYAKDYSAERGAEKLGISEEEFKTLYDVWLKTEKISELTK